MDGSGGKNNGQQQSPTATTGTKAGSTSLFDPDYDMKRRGGEFNGFWNRDYYDIT